MTEGIALVVLIGAGLVVISAFTSLIAFRVGTPLLLIFLGVGLLAGEDGPGGIRFEDAGSAYFIGSVALAVILFDSGITTPRRMLRVAAGPATVLATVGVLLTAVVLAVPIHFLLDLPWLEALLLGAIVGSTDAAAVFFLLRVGGIQIRERVRATLEVESASNDPMAIFLTVLLVETIAAGTTTAQDISWNFLSTLSVQFGLGALCGVVFGYLIVQGLNRVRLETGLFPIVIVGLALCVFSITSLLGGSGFLAAYIAGLVMGNMELKGGLAFRRFQEGLTWLAQITMFLVLGLLAAPSEFPAIAWQSVVIGLALMLVARPIAIWLCLMPFGFHRNEATFIAWVGLRGAVSILLAILPLVAGFGSGHTLFNAAFIIVLTSLLVQGWTLRPVAKWLGVVVPPKTGAVDKIELELPGTARHELVVYRIVADSPVVLGERIPRWARPSLIVRDGRSMRVHEAGRLQPGDSVYIFAPPRLTGLLDRLFASKIELSESDLDYFGEFEIDATQSIGNLADAYGFEIVPDEREVSVGDFLRKRLGNPMGRGDRLVVGPVELIVRDIDIDNDRMSIGLAVEPTTASTPRLPLFQSFQEISVALRAWLKRRSFGSTDKETND
ncbi:potassium/proton antiporter [Oceanibacterium hippocampi]|uniref:K(+)/H(+) antiporter NhaP n=1 Tax=Oceanibacterium hippocampi TaxID=745714 RepID=A0A1Y5S5W5_9PROT|nr:potassium/proton antiporter [Oceanibacterium hippocampi]SLN32943.1 K(+)/H(+) antiporter NhaP [Oceanibacterium hippocampi]